MILSKLFKNNTNFNSNSISRTEIINYLIKKYSYKTYLEIGVRDPKTNFDKIKINFKDGIDPNWLDTPIDGNQHIQESDDYFSSLDKTIKFDIIFIDGLHLEDQVDKDINSSLNHLSENGAIIIHDCNPITESRQREEYEVNGEYPNWNGTTWKSWVKLRCTKSDLSMDVINADEGCGIIIRGSQTIWGKDPVEKCTEYSYLKKYRQDLLNLISVSEFLSKY